jgi:predicted nucleotidyltransferase
MAGLACGLIHSYRVRVISEADIDRYGRVLADAASSRAQVTLFGSYARRTASITSNLDFLVIEEHVDSRAAESVRLRDALADLDIPVDVLVMSQEHAGRRAQIKGTTVATALAEGRVVAES